MEVNQVMNVTKIHALMNINGSRQKLTEAPKSIKKSNAYSK